MKEQIDLKKILRAVAKAKAKLDPADVRHLADELANEESARVTSDPERVETADLAKLRHPTRR